MVHYGERARTSAKENLEGWRGADAGEGGDSDECQSHLYLGPTFSNTPLSFRKGSVDLQKSLWHHSAEIKSSCVQGCFGSQQPSRHKVKGFLLCEWHIRTVPAQGIQKNGPSTPWILGAQGLLCQKQAGFPGPVFHSYDKIIPSFVASTGRPIHALIITSWKWSTGCRAKGMGRDCHWRFSFGLW